RFQRCSTAGVLVSAASSSDRSFSMCWPRCQTRGTHAVGGIR
ncbi:TPA: transposase, partial [Klebsiella pneumoniae]|nr:transposase [Klebsiella pneumoniae]